MAPGLLLGPLLARVTTTHHIGETGGLGISDFVCFNGNISSADSGEDYALKLIERPLGILLLNLPFILGLFAVL